MDLYRTLADGLLEEHPEDAARALESLPERDALLVLSSAREISASTTLRHMAPNRAAAVLAKLEPQRAGVLVEHLGLDLAASILRRVDEGVRGEIVDALSPPRSRSLRSLLRFPDGTAGSIMDPEVLALPADRTVEEALREIRATPQHVRYSLYVIDREHVLVGVLNLRELLLARAKDTLGSIAHPEVLSIPADADRLAILAHPIWRTARSVPVVDDENVYLGAVRFRAMVRLQEQLQSPGVDGSSQTAEALGDLFATGIAGVIGALVSSVGRPGRKGGA